MLKLVLDFWRNQDARGDKRRGVWLIMSEGHIQPRGYIYGWTIHKTRAKREANKLISAGEAVALVRLAP
jgi:hypothetical protein